VAHEAPYDVEVTRTARRQLTDTLPEAVAAAALEFIGGPLREEPRRVGKPLLAPLQGQWSARRGEYRVVYRLDDSRRRIIVLAVQHRRDAYRS
jgi:mRNA interferase RelE/StbE